MFHIEINEAFTATQNQKKTAGMNRTQFKGGNSIYSLNLYEETLIYRLECRELT